MYYSKIPNPVSISHINYILSNPTRPQNGQVGRVSFLANGFIHFKNVPLLQVADCDFQLDFSALENGAGHDQGVISLLNQEDIRQAIQSQVSTAIREVVG